jgi:uncharacterized delta-60 repeat protein
MARRLFVLAFTVVLAAFDAGLAHGAPGDLDASYADGGVFVGPQRTLIPGESVHRLALDHLGRALVAFRSTADGNDTDIRLGVLRLTTEGDLDPTFNPNGTTPGLLVTGFGDPGCLDGTANGPTLAATAVSPDHHIVIAANLCQAVSAGIVGIMRLDDTGAFDDGFDGDGKLLLTGYQSIAQAVAVDASDRIYVAGGHCKGGGLSGCIDRNAFITRITKEGTRDQTFNAGGAIPGIFELALADVTTYFNALTVLAGDHIVAVGSYRDSAIDALVARIDGTGALETAFNPSGATPGVVRTDMAKGPAPGSIPQAELHAVTTTDDDESVVVSGQNTTLVATCKIAKFTSSGALDTTFASTQPTPGMITIPGFYTCRHLLTQTDGKIVALGWGPRPLGPGLSDTNQIMLARLEADGDLDQGFGVGGIVKTPLGNYALADAGALQGDGRILAGGIRRDTSNSTNPVVSRYFADPGPTPTPTGGAGDPTPTATPVDEPGEICGNCVDDEQDGRADRADPECGERANGNGQGLGDPKTAGKAVTKCGKALQSAGAKLGEARLAHLQRCAQAVFACVQLKAADSKCLLKATATCAKQAAAEAKDDAKLDAAVTKACGAPLALDDLTGATGLGLSAELQACVDAGVATLGSLSDVAACVRARESCAAERLLALQMPRAADLLAAGSLAPGSCLPAAGALGAGLADPDRTKAAVKCQGALVKAASKLAASERDAALACLQAAARCVQLKPGDAACLAKLRATCAKKIGALSTPSGVEAKLAAAVAKSCDGLAPGDLTSADGLGFQTHAAECATLGAPGATAAAIADCVRRQHECRLEEVLDATTPRAGELFELGQVALP